MNHSLQRTAGPKTRQAVGIVDQAVYSAGNFALIALVASNSSSADFGAFAVVSAIFLTLQATVRGASGDALFVGFAAKPRAIQVGAGREMMAFVLGSSLVMMAIFCLVGVVLGNFTGRMFLVFGIGLPGLLVQDALRYVALSQGRSHLALSNDLLQVVVQGALTLVLWAHGSLTPLWVVTLWISGAYVASIVTSFQLATVPTVSKASARWLGVDTRLSASYALDNFIQQAGQYVSVYLLALMSSAAAAGALRAGVAAFGPATVFFLGAQTALIPYLVRLGNESASRLTRSVCALGIALGLGGACCGIALMSLPTGVGAFLFGQTWSGVTPLLAALTIAQAANGVRIAGMAGIRAMNAPKITLRGRYLTTPIAMAVPAVGAIAWGAKGAAVAMAIASPIQTVIWIHLLLTCTRATPNEGVLTSPIR